MINCKVILTGCYSVGKTSLFNQFLYKKFSEKYLTTIGVRVDKKVVELAGGSVNIMLWDIAGEMTQNKVPVAYFLGASAIIYVIDLSRSFTWANLQTDLEYLQKLSPDCPIKIIGNKKDLLSIEELPQTLATIPHDIHMTTSAKTGENVEALFNLIAYETISPKRIPAEHSHRNE